MFDPGADSTGAYMITGHRYPILSRMLQPEESIKADTGSLLFSGPSIKMKTSLQGGLSAAVSGDMLKVSRGWMLPLFLPTAEESLIHLHLLLLEPPELVYEQGEQRGKRFAGG